MRSIFLLCTGVVLSMSAFAQPPKPTAPSGTAMVTVRTTDLDRSVLDSLKEVHNKGAEFYNAGDHGGALRIYQGGLIVAKPFLAHRAKLQAEIQEGLDQIEKSNADAKLKAFRLHEVIEQVRGELKDELKKIGEKSAEAAASGTVTVHGKPAAGVAVAFIPIATTKALATAKTLDGGTFNIVTSLPVGRYLITLSGEGVPMTYAKAETTPLKEDLKPGVNSLNFEAK